MPRRKSSKVKFDDKTKGKIKERRFGLRIDDDVEVYIIAGDALRIVKGRILDYKKDLHLEDDDGRYHKISFDWIADIVVLAHNRPHPSDDPEYQRKKEPEPIVEPPPQDHAYT